MERASGGTRVWAVRDAQKKCGLFTTDEEKATELKNSRCRDAEIREFDLSTDWKEMCQYFTGWDAEDYACAAKLRIAYLDQ